MTKRTRNLLRGIGVCAGIYVLAYWVLSINGRYEPLGWGLSGPKDYQWAPAGFVHDLRWRMPMIWTFLPCWEFDRFFWHSEDRMYQGKLPVNDIAEGLSQ